MNAENIKILIIDDEPDMVENLDRILRYEGYQTLLETDSTKVLELIEREQPDLVLTDLQMPEIDGMAILDYIKGLQWGIPVIMITGYASVDSAVKAMQKGASDYIAKPFSPEELVLKIEKAFDRRRLMEENTSLREQIKDRNKDRNLVGQHPSFMKILEVVDKVATTDSRVLLVGESGTGKELIAQTLHRRSHRRHAPFFAINCGSLTETLLESELFGHERGSFTGATTTKKGIFEAAKGGTLFLDEIADTVPAFQTKLLRVIERAEFMRVGGTRLIKTDVRVIAASNQNFAQAIETGKFREDLFYRLSVVQIVMPPLRERLEDIPILAEHFLTIHSRKIKKIFKGIHSDAIQALSVYQWPGNIRELENVIERAVIMAEPGDYILPSHLPYDILQNKPESMEPKNALQDAEKEIIIKTLRECDWNRSLTAKRLGIGRRTLYDKISRLGISLKPNL